MLVNADAVRIQFMNDAGGLREVSSTTLGAVALAISAELQRREDVKPKATYSRRTPIARHGDHVRRYLSSWQIIYRDGQPWGLLEYLYHPHCRSTVGAEVHMGSFWGDEAWEVNGLTPAVQAGIEEEFLSRTSEPDDGMLAKIDRVERILAGEKGIVVYSD